MSQVVAIREPLIAGQDQKVKELVQQALAADITAQQILLEGLLPAMEVVGEKFEKNEFYVPQVLFAARAMHAGLELLKPHLARQEGSYRARVLIGTARGDQHDIGKNLVGMMLTGGGFEVIDLGKDVAPHTFVGQVQQTGSQAICISALMTTTMPAMAETITALEQAGLRDKVKVLVGGAPVTQKFADEIGADGYADNANGAVVKIKSLLALAS